jgi:hypothetical protein
LLLLFFFFFFYSSFIVVDSFVVVREWIGCISSRKKFRTKFLYFFFLVESGFGSNSSWKGWFFGFEENEGFCLLRGTKNVQIVQEFC